MLADLYTRYSARLASHVAQALHVAGADALADTDDITQDIWLEVATLDIPPAAPLAWPTLTELAARMVGRHLGADHLTSEVLAGMALPATRVLSPAPMARPVLAGRELAAA